MACLWLFAMAAVGCDEKFDGPPSIVPAQLAFGPTGMALLPPQLVPIADGDTLPLVEPIQGGHVLFVGFFGHNLSTRSASVLGELRRSIGSDGMPLTADAPGGVLYSDQRSVDVQLVPAGMPSPSGAADTSLSWQEVPPDPTDMANIPTCPNPLDVDVVDDPLFLAVQYSDDEGRSARVVLKVVPRCLQSDPNAQSSCNCDCRANYTTDRCLTPPDLG